MNHNLTKREVELLEVIMDLLCQHADDGSYDRENESQQIWDSGLSANECAIDMLKKYKLFEDGKLFYKRLWSLARQSLKEE
jgi:hypothetical protein